MRSYLALVRDVLDNGEARTDRTQTGTLSLFAPKPLDFDLRDGFPLVTTKRTYFKGVIRELLWFLKGSTNISDLDSGIWNQWAAADGSLGPVYGHQWRSWGGVACRRCNGNGSYALYQHQDHKKPCSTCLGSGWIKPGIDQIKGVIRSIKHNPGSRRHIVSAWNVADLPEMALAPCHLLFQFYCSEDGEWLDLQLYQRSADLALGVPFNIASYATLLTLIAREVGRKPRRFVHTFGDAHVYTDHVENLRIQLEREPFPSPKLEISDKPMDELVEGDFKLINYNHHGKLRFKVAV